jgi:hypothetical protein
VQRRPAAFWYLSSISDGVANPRIVARPKAFSKVPKERRIWCVMRQFSLALPGPTV